MWVRAKQVTSQSKPSKSARRRVLELESDPPREGTGENFVTEGSRRAAGKGALESLRGRGRIGSRLGVGSCAGSRGPASPRRRAGPARLRSPSGATGRSWPQPRPRLGPDSSPSRQVPSAGTRADVGDGVPTGGSDRNLFSQRGGMFPMSRGPGLFLGLHQRRRRRRLLPHTRVIFVNLRGSSIINPPKVARLDRR
ncbi:collagen alpha-2(I) chain-like [Pseudorca crassidens]|uniref:collagen alpha-2(I) chain-like n=1 Tax=Pseudorca crassidens TaxID=82174 RepID=UPI00352CCA1F